MWMAVYILIAILAGVGFAVFVLFAMATLLDA